MSAEARRREGTSAPGLRARGLIVAFLLAPLHAAWLVYGDVVLGVTVSAASLLPSVLAILFLLTVVNAGVGRVRPSWKLSSVELVVCYVVLTLSGIITGFDFLQLLPHSLMYPSYFGRTSPELSALGQSLPSWFRPTDPALVKSFYEGRAGLFDPALWRAWLLPLVLWTGFAMTVLLTMLCINVLVREQWLHNERLPFPIVELPLTLCDDDRRDSLFRSKLFWGAFAGTLGLLSLNALSMLFPSLPGVRLSITNIARDFQGPLSAANPLVLVWTPFTLGLLYFVPLDLLFSAWFFYLLRKAFEVVSFMYGHTEALYGGGGHGQFSYVLTVTQGAWIGLAIVLLRGGRRHFAHVLRRAFPPRGEPADRTYRRAILGVLGGCAALTLFEWAAGMRLWLALVYFVLFFVASLVMTRVFAQIGTSYLELYFFNTETLLLSFIGTRSLQGPEVALLGQCFWFNHAYRQHPMGQQLAAMKMADQVGLRLRPLAAVLAGAMLVGTVVGLVVLLGSYHTLGAATAKVNGSQNYVGGWETWNRALGWQANPKEPQTIAYLVMAVSSLFCIGMGRLGDVWIGSPFRPVGFVLAFSFALDLSWNLFVVVWFIKLLIMRYGGLKIYRQAAPLFLGMALGDAIAQVVWGGISALTGTRDLSVYLPPRW